MVGRLLRLTGATLTLGTHFQAMGWNYLLQWAVVLPLEITVAGITVQYWEKAAGVPIAAWITSEWRLDGLQRGACLRLPLLFQSFGSPSYS